MPPATGQPSLVTTTEAYLPQSLCCTTREVTAVRSPWTAAREKPPLTAVRESLRTTTKTQHSQIKQKQQKTQLNLIGISRKFSFYANDCYLYKSDNRRSVSPRVEKVYLWSTRVLKNMVSGVEILGLEPDSATYWAWTLGKCPHLENGNNSSTDLIGLLWVLNEFMCNVLSFMPCV